MTCPAWQIAEGGLLYRHALTRCVGKEKPTGVKERKNRTTQQRQPARAPGGVKSGYAVSFAFASLHACDGKRHTPPGNRRKFYRENPCTSWASFPKVGRLVNAQKLPNVPQDNTVRQPLTGPDPLMITGKSFVAGIAYCNGSPVNVSMNTLNIPTATIVFDYTNKVLYFKTSTTDNSAFSTLAFAAGGALTPASIAATGAITTSSPSAGIGYATGAGGAVTQITSKATGVTLATRTGAITLNNAALGAGAEATFTVACTGVLAGDVGIANHVSAGTSGAYMAAISNVVAATSFDITVSNLSAGSLSEAIVIGYALFRGAIS